MRLPLQLFDAGSKLVACDRSAETIEKVFRCQPTRRRSVDRLRDEDDVNIVGPPWPAAAPSISMMAFLKMPLATSLSPTALLPRAAGVV
jgi:hypothetical protein